MSAPLPSNKRRAPAPTIDAPVDPSAFADDLSPPPGVATTSVRPPAQPKPKKPKSRLLRSLELAAGIVIAAGASVAVAWGARHYILTSPRFGVKAVAVDGVHRRSAAHVAGLGGLEIGKNVFTIDLETSRRAIVEDPWIEKATVTRKLPSTIEVKVVEREAAAVVSIAGDLYLATRDGDLFKRAATEDPSDLPLVTGILPDQVARDRAGAVLAVKRVLDVAEDMERAGISKRWPIEELHLERDGSLAVTIGREAIQLELGQPPYKDKIAEGARVLQEVQRRRANPSVIFLDNDAHPERVVVRMR